MADDNTPVNDGTGANAASGEASQGAAPWYQGGDAELIGHIQNRGLHEKTAAEAAFELARAHREAERYIGVPADQVLKLPKDPTDSAGWRAVQERLGAPKDAAGYDFSSVKKADGSVPDAAFVDAMRAAAAELALTQDAAARVAASFVKFQEGQGSAKATADAAAATEAKDRLTASWGQNMESNTFVADQAAAKLGIKPEVLAKLKDGMGADGVMQMFLKIGVSMGEDKYVASGGVQGNAPRSTEQAVADKSSLMKDQGFVKRYLDGDVEARNQMRALDIIISGESDTGYRAQ